MPKNQLDFEIRIKYLKFYAHISSDIYDDIEQEKIKNIIDKLSREIAIDKTYVKYKNTKFEKCFLTENGWNEICQLLKLTKKGKKTTKDQYYSLQYAYYLMAISYMYQCLDDFGYSSDGILLEIKDKTLYMIEITEDTYKEYKRYPGKWQTWKSLH